MKPGNLILTSQYRVFEKSLKCSKKRQDLLLCSYLASRTYIEPFPSIPYSSILFLNVPFYYYPENPTENESFCAYLHEAVAAADELYIVTTFSYDILHRQPVPVAARSKAWVCGRSPSEIVGSNPTGGMDVCLL